VGGGFLGGCGGVWVGVGLFVVGLLGGGVFGFLVFWVVGLVCDSVLGGVVVGGGGGGGWGVWCFLLCGGGCWWGVCCGWGFWGGLGGGGLGELGVGGVWGGLCVFVRLVWVGLWVFVFWVVGGGGGVVVGWVGVCCGVWGGGLGFFLFFVFCFGCCWGFCCVFVWVCLGVGGGQRLRAEADSPFGERKGAPVHTAGVSSTCSVREPSKVEPASRRLRIDVSLLPGEDASHPPDSAIIGINSKEDEGEGVRIPHVRTMKLLAAFDYGRSLLKPGDDLKNVTCLPIHNRYRLWVLSGRLSPHISVAAKQKEDS